MALGALVVLAPGGADAGSSDEAAETVLTAEAVFSTEYDVGDVLAIRATVSADRLIAGRVEARSSGATVTAQAVVDVAGGSSKEYLLLLPTSQMGDARVTVELFDGSTPVDSDVVAYTHDINTDVAGVLPTLLTRVNDLPPRVTLLGDTKRVNMVALPAEMLDEGAAAVSQLNSIAGTSDDLTRLSASGKAALMTWLAHGGQLVLDDSDDLSALPPAWQPGEAGFARAELGTVYLADGALSAGKWSDELLPVPLSSTDNQFGFFGMDMIVDPRITLAKRAGVTLPNLSKIVLALAVYVVILGPIMYLILRRMRRLTAAWVVIPAASVLVAVGVVATGSSWRTSGKPTSASIVELSAGGGYAYSDTLMFRRSAGRSSLQLPASWASTENNSSGWWFGGGERASSVKKFVSDGDSRRLDVDLESGQVAVLTAEGSVTDAQLTITSSTTAAGTVEGTVTNTTPWTLQSVAALAPGVGMLIGDLAPGESKPFKLAKVKASAQVESPAGTIWPAPEFGRGFGAPAPGFDAGIWTSFASRKFADLYPVGFVRIAGWTSERPSDVLDDSEVGTATLVTAISAIEPLPSGALQAYEVPNFYVEPPWNPQNGQPGQPVIRFDVPASSAADDLQLTVFNRNMFKKFELLGADGKWTEVKATAENKDVYLIPDDAVLGGSVLIRFDFDQNFGFDPSQRLVEVQGVPRG